MMIAAAVLSLGGCASVGHDFQYQSKDSYGRDTLELGTPSAKYATMFGEPVNTMTNDTVDGKFKLIRYQYASANLATARSRLLDLEFRNDSLNSYIYISSFDDDKTIANTEQLSQVKRGTSKNSDIFKILGKPQGMALCPSTHPDFKDKCNKGTQIWKWVVMEGLSTLGSSYGAKQIEERIISISFDKDGVVTDVDSFSNHPE